MEVSELERKVKELTLANWSLENSLDSLGNKVDQVQAELQECNRRLDEALETEGRISQEV